MQKAELQRARGRQHSGTTFQQQGVERVRWGVLYRATLDACHGSQVCRLDMLD